MAGRSFIRIPSFGAAVLLLVALLVSVPALGQQRERDERRERERRTQDGLSRDGEGGKRLERFREAEERRQARRRSPEAREERRRSRRAFRGQSRQEALSTARDKHPELIETPVFDPLRLRADERVTGYFGEFSARIVDEDGDRKAVDSTVPLRSEVGTGEKRPVDLGLVDTGEELVPENPLVETEIPDTAAEPVVLGDDLSVSLQTPSVSEAAVVEDRAFYANALADTDMLVMPSTRGAQISLQVRSEDAPEQAVLPLSLPDGAEAELVPNDGSVSSEPPGPPPGSVKIVREGELIGLIQPPAAWDADNEPFPVSYALEGENLVVSYPHRGLDLAFPLAVDPVIERFRLNENGDRAPTSFLITQDSIESGWGHGFGNGATAGLFQEFPRITPGGAPFEHYGSIGMYTHKGQYVYYPDNSYANWAWRAPRQTRIVRADFNFLDFQATQDNYPRIMCVAQGIASFQTYNWESGAYYVDARDYPFNQAHPPNPNTTYGPWSGGPAPRGSCSPQSNVSKSHFVPSGGSPGNAAIFRLFAYGAGTRNFASNADLEGAAVTLDDVDFPTVTATSSSPTGWVRSGNLTTRVAATDPGLGVIAHGLRIPIEGGSPTGPVQFTTRCDRGRISRCPADFDHTFSYNINDILVDDPAYQNTLGAQKIPDGIHTVQGTSYDGEYNPTDFQAGQIKIDRTPPNWLLAIWRG